MAYTDIQICNLALSHIGDIATVASISAPTTPQERYCASFYPMARDLTLEAHTWNFITVRVALATSTVTPPSTWQYAYDVPSGTVQFLSVIDPNATDDYTAPVNYVTLGLETAPVANLGVRAPYPYVIEYDTASGKQVLYTNLESAVGRYTVSITDPAKYPIDFVMALSYRLAGMLAGPIIKTDAGTKISMDMNKLADGWLMRATESDTSQRQVEVSAGAPWIVGRG